VVGDLFSPPLEELPDFRGLADRLPPEILFGTSSWNYPGWKGLVYHQDHPKNGAAAKMLSEYVKFPLFRTIGIDSSFYAPPTPEQLQKYAQRLPPGFPCVMKVWDRFTVHTLPRARYGPLGGELNPDFLNADLFRSEVLDFYLAHFRDHTGPLVFEFQTISRSSGISPEDFADRLDRFLSVLPRDASYSVEIRNREFLTPAYLAVLREHNVAHVFNSLAEMPGVDEQMKLEDCRTHPELCASRFLLKPGRSYNQAVNAFAPYDRIREPNPELRTTWPASPSRGAPDTGLRAGEQPCGGSAPLTIAAIAEMVSGA
jgi:uncharacterized protein YecE (DUF72 family)